MRIFLRLFSLVLLFISVGCNAQSNQKLIVNQQSVDIKQYPIYHDLVASDSQFEYLNNLEIKELTYLSDGLKVKAFVIQPKDGGAYPCIIYNRGGNREFGAWNPSGVIRFLGPIANQGFVVIASQYRGNGGGEGQEEFGGKEVNDVIILPNVLGELEKADTTRIGMYGWSRGGMMTYLALAKMNNIKAAVVGGGVTDHFDLLKDRPSMEESVYAELIPKFNKRKDEELTKRSVVFWADQLPKNTPLLLMHGGSDWRVKSSQSLKLALKLDEFRVPYRLIVYEGDDHGISNHQKEVNQEAMNWFNRFVMNGELLPKTELYGK